MRVKIDEPKFKVPMSKTDLIQSLNWYHQNKESKDAQKYIQDYAKRNKISGSLNIKENYLLAGVVVH